jgi:hypothetical protein
MHLYIYAFCLESTIVAFFESLFNVDGSFNGSISAAHLGNRTLIPLDEMVGSRT